MTRPTNDKERLIFCCVRRISSVSRLDDAALQSSTTADQRTTSPFIQIINYCVRVRQWSVFIYLHRDYRECRSRCWKLLLSSNNNGILPPCSFAATPMYTLNAPRAIYARFWHRRHSQQQIERWRNWKRIKRKRVSWSLLGHNASTVSSTLISHRVFVCL